MSDIVAKLETGKKKLSDTTLPFCPMNLMSPARVSCQTSHSPHEPIFLTNSTSSIFEYPIYESIAYQSGRISIICPINLVIHIHSGRQYAEIKIVFNCLSHFSAGTGVLPKISFS